MEDINPELLEAIESLGEVMKLEDGRVNDAFEKPQTAKVEGVKRDVIVIEDSDDEDLHPEVEEAVRGDVPLSKSVMQRATFMAPKLSSEGTAEPLIPPAPLSAEAQTKGSEITLSNKQIPHTPAISGGNVQTANDRLPAPFHMPLPFSLVQRVRTSTPSTLPSPKFFKHGQVTSRSTVIKKKPRHPLANRTIFGTPFETKCLVRPLSNPSGKEMSRKGETLEP